MRASTVLVSTALVSTALSATSALAAALLVAPAGASAAPPGITVLNITGSGCKPMSNGQPTAVAALSTDRTALTITYSQYILTPGDKSTQNKDCRINLKVEGPAGYAPTITSVDYRGFAILGTGSSVQMTAHYGFHGASHVESAALHLTGDFGDDWETTDTAQGGLVTGNCKGSNVVDVDSALSLISKSAGDYVSMDSTDGTVPAAAPSGTDKPGNTFHLTWKRCS